MNLEPSGRRPPILLEHEDVLKNIETAVVRLYAEQPELTDAQVDRVYELQIRTYKAEARGSAAALPQLGEMERELYRRVAAVCEWRMGRGDAPWRKANRADVCTPEEIIACLKHLRKSVQFWTRESGRQGYLNYVTPYVR